MRTGKQSNQKKKKIKKKKTFFFGVDTIEKGTSQMAATESKQKFDFKRTKDAFAVCLYDESDICIRSFIIAYRELCRSGT